MENTSTLVQTISGINDDTLIPLLSSPYIGEGVYGFEMEVSSEETQYLSIAPYLFRGIPGEETVRDYEVLREDISRLHCYRILLDKPSFLPLFIEQDFPLFDHLRLLQTEDGHIFAQFLFTKRTDRWRENALDQYLEYLNGNDSPAASKLGRIVQGKMLKVLDKLSGFGMKRDHMEEVEKKVLDTGYRFEIRVMYYGEHPKSFERELRETLKEMNFFNELALVKFKTSKEFLELYSLRKYSDISIDQMVSESELLTMLAKTDTSHKSHSIRKVMEQTKADVFQNHHASAVIGLLPVGKPKDRQVDMEIVEQIPGALKKARAIRDQSMAVKEVELGATVQRITFEIPSGVVYSDIKKKYEDIKAVLGGELSITQGNEPNTVTFLIPCKEREIIYLKRLLEDPKFIAFAEENPLPFLCGIDLFNELVMKCLTVAPHLLVAGATNSGKSVFVTALLITFILMKKPSELRMILIDPKKVEFGLFQGFVHIDKIVTDMSKATQTLEELINEMERRYELFAEKGVKNIKGYNGKKKEKLPYVVCAIDEYNDLKMQEPDVEEQIERLGQKARAAGIHLILATQRPDKNVMSGVIKTNFPSRISFSLSSTSEYTTVFGKGIPYKNLMGFGDGVVSFVGQSEEFIRFQAPVITLNEDEEEKTYNAIKKYYKGEKVEGLEMQAVAPVPEEPIDKLKKIILDTGETRIKQLQEMMNIRITIVQDLMKQLVEEGFLTFENRKYLVVSMDDGERENEENTNPPIDEEELFREAVEMVIEFQQASINMLQRRFRIGYTQGAKLIDRMEALGIVSEYKGSAPREVLVDRWEP